MVQTDIENQEQEQQAPLFSRLFRPELNLSGQSKKNQIDFGRLDDAQLKGKLQEKNLQGRVGFTGETKEGTSYGFGVNLSASKGTIKTPKELRQFGVPEELEFGSGKLKARSYDAFMSLQNIFGVEGLESRIDAGYTPSDYEKDIKNIGLNLKYKFAEGGTVMKKQMELFEDGGLKDEGGMIDEVSGNDVPSGSTREEVRDDIPAQLSEGEFVFPADVVRFIGLEKLMRLRQQAKQGLKQMEAMGQMGNSDEATMPDDLPFDETDLDMEDDLEYNTGGVVQAQRGTYVAPTVPTGSQPLGTTPMGAPPIPQQVGAGISGTAFGTPYTPNVGKMYGAGATPYAPVTYTELLGPSAAGAPQTKNVRYVNEATNQTRMIPHLLNADGTIGDTLYPVPQGFIRQDEAPKEEAKKTQVQTAKVTPVESGDGPPSEEPTGASLSFGGTKSGAGTGLQSGAVTGNISYNISAFGKAGIIGGLMTINAINQGKDVQTIGNKNGLTTNPVTVTVGKGKISLTSKQYANIKNNPTSKEAKSLKERLEVLNSIVQTPYTINPVTNLYTNKAGKTLSVEQANQAGKDVQDKIAQEVSKGKSMQSIIDNLTQTEVSVAQDYGIEDEDDQQTYGGYTGPTAGNLGSLSPNNDDDDDTSSSTGTSSSGVSTVGDDPSGPGDTGVGNDSSSSDDGPDAADDPGFKQGGLAKRKIKPKYMKRGGLASKK